MTARLSLTPYPDRGISSWSDAAYDTPGLPTAVLSCLSDSGICLSQVLLLTQWSMKERS